jgi:hypothetical protein
MNSNINCDQKSTNCETKAVNCSPNREPKSAADDKKPPTDRQPTDRRDSGGQRDDEMRRVYIRAPPNRHVSDIKYANNR